MLRTDLDSAAQQEAIELNYPTWSQTVATQLENLVPLEGIQLRVLLVMVLLQQGERGIKVLFDFHPCSQMSDS